MIAYTTNFIILITKYKISYKQHKNMQQNKSQISLQETQNFRQYCLQQTTKTEFKKFMTAVSKIQIRIYGYFANKSKHRLIVKNIYKKMAIYLKNR